MQTPPVRKDTPTTESQARHDAAWLRYDAAEIAYRDADATTRPAAWAEWRDATQELLSARRSIMTKNWLGGM